MSDQQRPQHAAKEKKESSDAAANRRVTRTKSYWLGENPAGDFDAWLRERSEANARGERTNVTAPITHDAASSSSTPLPRFGARPLDTAPMERSANGAPTVARGEHAEHARSSTIRWVQPKLRINAPGDRHEQEADRAADEVVKRIASGPERAAGSNGAASPTAKAASSAPSMKQASSAGPAPVKIQAKTGAPAAPATGGHLAPPSVDRALNAPGQALPQGTRDQMEEQFGEDFGDVRVHTSAAAADAADDINARAFTAGRSIVFGDGEFRPGTAEGDRLLAHELAHVVQQGGQAMAVQRDALDDAIMWPESHTLKDGYSSYIDSDGDQKKDLLVTIRLDKVNRSVVPNRVSATLILKPDGNGKAGTIPIDIPSDTKWIGVREISNGLSPTLIRIATEHDLLDVKSQHWITIAPPVDVTPKQAARRHLSYPVNSSLFPVVAPINVKVQAPDDAARNTTVAAPDAPTLVSDVASLDLALGIMGDRFRLTVEPRYIDAKQAIIGLAALNATDAGPSHRIQPVGGNTPFGSHFKHITLDKDTYVVMPGNIRLTPQLRVIESTNTHITIDLNNDGSADIGIYDSMYRTSQDLSPKYTTRQGVLRHHKVSIVQYHMDGSSKIIDTFDFQVKREGRDRSYEGRLRDDPVNDERQEVVDARLTDPKIPDGTKEAIVAWQQRAAANAASVTDIGSQRRDSDFMTYLGRLEEARASIRKEAASAGYIRTDTLAAAGEVQIYYWLLQLRPETRAKADVVATFTDKLNAFHNLFLAETEHQFVAEYYGEGVFTDQKNRFTHDERGNSKSGLNDSLTTDIIDDVREGEWDDAFESFRTLMAGYDDWIDFRFTEEKDPTDRGARLKKLAGLSNEMGSIVQHNPKRVLAQMYPDESYTDSRGYASSIPMILFYWYEDDGDSRVWQLRDATAATSHIKYTETTPTTVNELPHSLLAQLDDSHHPKGIIKYEVHRNAAPRDGTDTAYSGTIRTTHPMSLSNWLMLISAGLLLVGLTVASAGAGMVAFEAFMIASQVVGGAAALIQLVDEAQHDTLTTQSAVMLAAIIASSLLGTGALGAGMIRGAAADAGIAARWTGLAARIGLMANEAYIPLRLAGAGADMVTVLVMTEDILAQIKEAIEHGGPDQERTLAFLFLQLIITGAMGAYLVKDTGHLIEHQNDLYFYLSADGTLAALPAETRPLLEQYKDEALRLLDLTRNDRDLTSRLIGLRASLQKGNLTAESLLVNEGVARTRALIGFIDQNAGTLAYIEKYGARGLPSLFASNNDLVLSEGMMRLEASLAKAGITPERLIRELTPAPARLFVRYAFRDPAGVARVIEEEGMRGIRMLPMTKGDASLTRTLLDSDRLFQQAGTNVEHLLSTLGVDRTLMLHGYVASSPESLALLAEHQDVAAWALLWSENNPTFARRLVDFAPEAEMAGYRLRDLPIAPNTAGIDWLMRANDVVAFRALLRTGFRPALAEHIYDLGILHHSDAEILDILMANVPGSGTAIGSGLLRQRFGTLRELGEAVEHFVLVGDMTAPEAINNLATSRMLTSSEWRDLRDISQARQSGAALVKEDIERMNALRGKVMEFTLARDYRDVIEKLRNGVRYQPGTEFSQSGNSIFTSTPDENLDRMAPLVAHALNADVVKLPDSWQKVAMPDGTEYIFDIRSGQRPPDMLIGRSDLGDVLADLYTPTSPKASSIMTGLKEKHDQAGVLILDLSKSTVPMDAFTSNPARLLNQPHMKDVDAFLITKDGVTFKQISRPGFPMLVAP